MQIKAILIIQHTEQRKIIVVISVIQITRHQKANSSYWDNFLKTSYKHFVCSLFLYKIPIYEPGIWTMGFRFHIIQS